MVANEMFLDSAGHRDSVVSIAKNLGYVPSSILAATATVNLTITSSVNTGVILPQYTKFTATDIDTDQSYIFVTESAHSTTTYTANGGKVLYTSTDQSGNFRIGDDLSINQETGTISGRSFSKSLFSEMTPFILALS